MLQASALGAHTTRRTSNEHVGNVLHNVGHVSNVPDSMYSAIHLLMCPFHQAGHDRIRVHIVHDSFQFIVVAHTMVLGLTVIKRDSRGDTSPT